MLHTPRRTWRIGGYDYGERKLGTSIVWQSSRREPIHLEFLDNINLFPKTKPTVQSLMVRYNMRPLTEASNPDTVESDELLMSEYETKWRTEFEALEDDVSDKKKRRAKIEKQLEKLSAAPTSQTNEDKLHLLHQELGEIDALPFSQTTTGRGTKATRWNKFVLGKVFGATDMDEEEDDEIPASLDAKTEGMNEVLEVYFQFWELCIGPIDRVDIETQVLAIGAKGALGQSAMGALMVNLANPKARRRPRLKYIDPKWKLLVFPFTPAETRALGNAGKIMPKWWMSIGPSGNLKIRIAPMPEPDRKRLLPSFFHEDDDSHEDDKPSSVIKASKKVNPKKRKRDDAGGFPADPIEDDENKVIYIDLLSSSDEADEAPTDKPAPKKKHKTKKTKATDNDEVEDDVLVVGEKSPPKKKPFRGPGGVRGKAQSYAYFSPDDAKLAAKRIFNKKEAVRRVKLIFANHRKDVIGAKWMLRFEHKWNEDMKRDAADAFTQSIYCLHMSWLTC